MQVGVASIAAAVQRGGGSEQHPGSTLDADLEVIAASIETAALPEAHVFGRSILPFCQAEADDCNLQWRMDFSWAN